MQRVFQYILIWALSLGLPAIALAGGIKFQEIKPGTEYHFVGDAVRFMSRYVGMQDGAHVIQNHFSRSGKLYQIERYDAKGRLIEIVSLGFKHRHVFTPFHCKHSEARRCAHKMTFYKDGKRQWAQTQQYEIRKTGKAVTVIKNADTNRLKTRYTLDAQRVATQKRQGNSSFADNWKLVKKRVPAN